jgi:hypothetical protein
LTALVLASGAALPLYSQSAPNVTSKEQIRALVITIHRKGFDPLAATVADRKLMLIVQDADGLKAHTYSFQTAGTGPAVELLQSAVKVHSKDWATPVILSPEQYGLIERGQGNRTFTLTAK